MVLLVCYDTTKYSFIKEFRIYKTAVNQLYCRFIEIITFADK